MFPPAPSTAMTRTQESLAALTGLQEHCFPPSFFQLEGCCQLLGALPSLLGL